MYLRLIFILFNEYILMISNGVIVLCRICKFEHSSSVTDLIVHVFKIVS